jgi:hypothetical protein
MPFWLIPLKEDSIIRRIHKMQVRQFLIRQV